MKILIVSGKKGLLDRVLEETPSYFAAPSSQDLLF